MTETVLTPVGSSLYTINDITAPVTADMSAVSTLIMQRLQSDVVLINQLGNYIVNSGGKRLRPLLTVLSARACGYQGEQHIVLAAIIEFIHTATLLHDDVVDESELRRGKKTANNIWGSAASVLVGDFLYSRAFEMMVEVKQMRILELLAHTTNRIAEGEVLQLLNVHNPETTEADYLKVIAGKTARLFAASAQLGAILTNLPAEQEAAMRDYGQYLGMAFQLIDDVLDYTAEPAVSGKNIGDDLAEGKPTLPLIYALQNSEPALASRLQQAIQQGGRAHIDLVMHAIQQTDALNYSRTVARKQAEQATAALAAVPDSPYRQSLYELAEFAVARAH